MEVKTAKPILAITPPTETENVDSLEIDWDIRRCTPMMNLLTFIVKSLLNRGKLYS